MFDSGLCIWARDRFCPLLSFMRGQQVESGRQRRYQSALADAAARPTNAAHAEARTDLNVQTDIDTNDVAT